MSPFFVCHDTGLMEKEFSWRLHLFRLIPSEEPISAVSFINIQITGWLKPKIFKNKYISQNPYFVLSPYSEENENQ